MIVKLKCNLLLTIALLLFVLFSCNEAEYYGSLVSVSFDPDHKNNAGLNGTALESSDSISYDFRVTESDGYYINHQAKGFFFEQPEGTNLSKLSPTISIPVGYWLSPNPEDGANFNAKANYALYKAGGTNPVLKIEISILPKQADYANASLSRSQDYFAKKGLLVSSWVTESKETMKTDEYHVANFAAPCFGHGYPSNALIAKTNNRWTAFKNLRDTYPNNTPFTELDALSSRPEIFQIGDEKDFSTYEIDVLSRWFSSFRNQYPDMLLHNNQWARQWNEDQLKLHLKYVKPDLITFDAYVFTDYGLYPVSGGSCTRLAMEVAYVRHFANLGHDLTGNKPIAFGQFVQAFQTGNGVDTGDYLITESQINFYNFLTITLGGKWLMAFRWLQDNPDVGIFFNADGSTTPTYDHFKESNGEIMKLSPILSRLITTDAYYLPGKQKNDKGKTIENPLLYPEMENYLPYWKDAKSDYSNALTISSKNTGTVNEQLPGDLYIGYFKPLPSVTATLDGSTQLPSDATYFMVCNGLTWGDGTTDLTAQKGSSDDSKQEVSLQFAAATLQGKTLYKVSRTTGLLEAQTLPENKYTFTLGGGKADLFIIK